MGKEILNLFNSNITSNIFLTATYQKTLNNFDIPNDCQFYWNVEDEIFCKKRNINKAKLRKAVSI